MSNYAPEKSVFPGFDKDRIDYFFFLFFFSPVLFAYFTSTHADSICD